SSGPRGCSGGRGSGQLAEHADTADTLRWDVLHDVEQARAVALQPASGNVHFKDNHALDGAPMPADDVDRGPIDLGGAAQPDGRPLAGGLRLEQAAAQDAVQIPGKGGMA